MTLEKVFNIAGAIVTLAIVAVVVQSPFTSRVIRSTGQAFSGAINAAQRI
jgi:hypothetical protein